MQYNKIDINNPEDIKEYLDKSIMNWRRSKENADNQEDMLVCGCYVDAYQSVRVSLFGELLPYSYSKGDK